MAWLDNSRVIAMFAVVLLHASALVVTGSDVGSEHWWFGNVFDSAVRWCVPVFVMISGALLLEPRKNLEGLRTFYSKRMSRVLLPLVFWSTFFVSAAFAKGLSEGRDPSVLDMIQRIASGRPYYHMWFLYMLTGLYLFTPFFRTIVAHASQRDLTFLVCAVFVLSAVNHAHAKFYSGGSELFVNWFLLYVPYFLAGYLIRQNTFTPSWPVVIAVFVASVLVTSVGFYYLDLACGQKTAMFFYGHGSVNVIAMSLAVMYALKTWTKPMISAGAARKLAGLTLGIYLVHPLALDLIHKKTSWMTSCHPAYSVPVVAIVVFGVSLTVVWVIKSIPYVRRIV